MVLPLATPLTFNLPGGASCRGSGWGEEAAGRPRAWGPAGPREGANGAGTAEKVPSSDPVLPKTRARGAGAGGRITEESAVSGRSGKLPAHNPRRSSRPPGLSGFRQGAGEEQPAGRGPTAPPHLSGECPELHREGRDAGAGPRGWGRTAL